MIIGHYGIAFWVARAKPDLPVWQPLVAVVWLDILHSSLVILGVEQAAVVPGITAVVPLDLIHYPYSHSLVAAIGWSLATLVLYLKRAPTPAARRGVALWMGAAVFSHYVCDLVAHRPDLPLVSGEPKLGFGMWHHAALTFAVENALLFGSLWWYWRRPVRPPLRERLALLGLALLGSALFFTFPTAPFPDDVRYTEAVALAMYILIPLVAWAAARPSPR